MSISNRLCAGCGMLPPFHIVAVAGKPGVFVHLCNGCYYDANCHVNEWAMNLSTDEQGWTWFEDWSELYMQCYFPELE